MEKTVSKEYHRITDITQPKSGTVGINSMIIRNYNNGRHGGWNNYCCYDGNGKGTYVEPHVPGETMKDRQYKKQLQVHGVEGISK